jgi:adenylate cyclase
VAYLNTLFEFMIASVNSNHGIMPQLLGDGLMAIFGAPLSFGNDAANAVRAALEIVERVQREVEAQGIPPTRIGIGLHAGEVLSGTVGSALHKEYKVTGDVVNLASRIEQSNKEFNTQLLISETVWHAVRG